MESIKLKAKLSAYTKGVLPQLPDDYIKDDAPDDGNTYGRKNHKWVDVRESGTGKTIILDEESGLNLRETDQPFTYALSIRQKVLEHLPEELEDDTTYYIIDLTPDIFINGGTAYSNGYGDLLIDNDYETIISGGEAATQDFDLSLLPINAKGEYNGN